MLRLSRFLGPAAALLALALPAAAAEQSAFEVSQSWLVPGSEITLTANGETTFGQKRALVYLTRDDTKRRIMLA